jgi:hypothetical protein
MSRKAPPILNPYADFWHLHCSLSDWDSGFTPQKTVTEITALINAVSLDLVMKVAAGLKSLIGLQFGLNLAGATLDFQSAMYFGFNGFPQRLGASVVTSGSSNLIWSRNKLKAGCAKEQQ